MKTIVILSGVKYSSTKQRPHHMATFFARKGYRVIYIGLPEQSKVLDLQDLSIYDVLNNFSERLENGVYNLKRIVKNNRKYDNGLDELLEKIEKELLPINTTFLVAFPEWVRFINRLSNKCQIIYDCMDDWESFVNDLDWGYSKEVVNNERKLASMADLVVTSARSLYSKMALLNDNVYYLPNGVWTKDYKPVHSNSIPQDINNIDGPIVFFMGGIAGWVDTDLISFLAKERPEYSFVFVGTEVKKKLPYYPNIYFLGHKNYEELPAYLNQARVAIIPFKVNKLTVAVTPLKFYEYLGSATPVVTTIMPDLLGLEGSMTALSYKEFLTHVDRYVDMDKSQYQLESNKAIKTSMEFDWSKLIEPLCSFIERENMKLQSKRKFLDDTLKLYSSYQQNTLIKNELLSLYNMIGNYELAIKLFNTDENDEDIYIFDYLQMALAYFQVGHFEKAIKVVMKNFENEEMSLAYFKSLINDDKNMVMLLEIYLFKLVGNIYKAIEIADKAIYSMNDTRQVLGLLAGLYMDLGEYETGAYYGVEAIYNRGDLSIGEVMDTECISLLVNYLTNLQQHVLAEDIVLSIITDNTFKEFCIQKLSTIYLSKYSYNDEGE
ncbi:glycosyltransferase family 1 protein [Halobacillus trueperi]|uniref:Glycosyltransferase family 1 protein n=1 Tax=Halobacillus trueperi TaxID=156205 RepID=A0A3D8VQB6_9BACI|nr:glycosyltransferase [Halobacillus trueperi]RDY71530.1 glycosyltransferase family 1 protein [Halobacillus trueperi]